MNGLAVCISWTEAPAAAGPQLRHMLDCMAHRGQDRCAVFTSPQAALGLAQTPTPRASSRLQGAGSLPGLWCVADLRLDNRDELQDVLDCAGQQPTDVKLLLRGYDR